MNLNNMADSMAVPDEKIQGDVEVLGEFINIFCSEKHHDRKRRTAEASGRIGRYVEKISYQYCEECRKLLLHAISKRILCPYDPKPLCKKCETHCYGREYGKKSGMSCDTPECGSLRRENCA